MNIRNLRSRRKDYLDRSRHKARRSLRMNHPNSTNLHSSRCKDRSKNLRHKNRNRNPHSTRHKNHPSSRRPHNSSRRARDRAMSRMSDGRRRSRSRCIRNTCPGDL